MAKSKDSPAPEPNEGSPLPWHIQYFVEEDGSIPAVVFEDSLPKKLAAKLAKWAEVVCMEGFDLGGGIFEACHGYGDLFEIRAKVGRDMAREFCVIDKSKLVLLSGIAKEIGEATPVSAFQDAAAALARYRKSGKLV